MFKKIQSNPVSFYSWMIGIALLASGLIQGVIISILMIVFKFPETIMDSEIGMLISLYSTMISVFLILYIALKKEKRSLESLGLINKHIIRRYSLGLFIGFVTLSVSLGITYLFGGATYVEFSFDRPILLPLFFFAFMIQGFEEELLCRGFMMFGLSKTQSMTFSVIFNSFFFALLHLGNPGITILPLVNLFLAGIVFSLLAVYFDDIWVASGAHSMWNFVQGNFYGILVSGMSMGPTVFKFELSGNALISGGNFGLEGGLGVFLVESITALIFYVFIVLYKRKSEIYKIR